MREIEIEIEREDSLVTEAALFAALEDSGDLIDFLGLFDCDFVTSEEAPPFAQTILALTDALDDFNGITYD